MRGLTKLGFVIALGLGAGCSGADADLGDDTLPLLPDGGMQESVNPETPFLTEDMPSRMPYPIVTLRGAADNADRILVEAEGINPIAQRVGSNGTFCIDVPISAAGTYKFKLTSLTNGVLSNSMVVTTEYDPAAPTIPGAQTCNGVDPAGCGTGEEVCGNLRDDDCNGFLDEADPACSSCERDHMEPNGDLGAPSLDAGTYDELHICGGEDDYFGVEAKAGDTIFAKAYFSDASGNLDMYLHSSDGMKTLATSTSFDDDEQVEYKAITAGRYVLRVKGAGPTDSADYSLFIRVTSGTP